MNQWLLNVVATGMQKLHLLSLERTPSADVIVGTAQAWVQALVADRDWTEERDAERFERAFLTLARTATRWPTVKELLDAMPRLPDPPRLAHQVRLPPNRDARASHLAQLLGADYNPRTKDPAYDPARERRDRQRERALAELQHEVDPLAPSETWP